MTSRDQKFAGILSVLLTATVAVNVIAFQEKAGTPTETSSIGARTQWLDNAAPGSPTAEPAPAAQPAAAAVPQIDTTEINAAEITRGIQRELNNRNYEAGPPDGIAGTVTRAAIFAYEYDNGLTLSGQPNADLLSRIVLGSSSIAPPASRPGSKMTPDGESFVRTVRQQLANLGYDVGQGAGLTPDFSRAIRKFEAAQKLPETGRISAPMVARMIHLNAIAKSRKDSRTASR